MIRTTLSVALCVCALVLGVVAAALASINRARGADLDRRQHWCETFSRQIELQRAENAHAEWLLMHGGTVDHETSPDVASPEQ